MLFRVATVNQETTSEPKKTDDAGIALIVFAQADLWSSLQSVSWCRTTGRLDTLFVYHTLATAPAAERLRKLCSRQWPDLKVVVPGEAGADLPAKVIERLREWRLFRPNLSHWVLDCTGALPCMFAAISRAGEEAPGWLIMRRIVNGSWQGLTAASGGRLNPAPLADAPTARQADALPLHILLPALYPDEEIELQWRESRAPDALAGEQLAAIIAAGKEANWDWRKMFEAAFGKPCATGDWGVDDFIGATLALLGVGNTRVHLPARLLAKRPCEQIFDVVAVHRGALWFFDCQRRLEPDPPAIFDNRLWQLAGAHRIVVRPGRWASLTERLLADTATTLLDCDDCRSLFSRLCALLDLDVPRVLRSIERDTLAPSADRLPVFSPATPAQHFSDAIHLDNCVFDLQRGASADAGGTPPPWLAARVAPDLWFLGGTLNRSVPAEELRQRLDDRLGKSQLEASVIFFEVSQQRLSWRSLVRMKGDGAQLGKWLHRWRNVPLVI